MHEHVVRATIESGTVEGFTRDGVNRWRSIPYARPPIGPLRLRAPQPVEPWPGVRYCHGFGNCAPQQRMYTILAPGKYQPMSEDCLTLNVVTPKRPADRPLPVMVFIHGGGYFMGSSATPIYDGAALARHGCVYVSVNYRLGALGCLDLSSLSNKDVTIDDNLYLRDLVMALRWVRDNVAVFGGDPDNVTIFGESAGAHAVATLLLDTLTPLALEVALTVQTELETRAAETDALRRQAVERARHRADLARRRYLAVDPDNRLVADSLEADWNDALRALQTAREDYERASAAATATLTDELKDRIRALATDFPALWSNPNTQQRDRKRMVRLLVDDVTLHKTDRIHLHVRFRGGQTHSLIVAIPPTSWQARQTRKDTVAELHRLLDTHTDAQTADALNVAGHRSGENKPFTAGIVVHVRRKYHLPSHADRLRAQGLLTTTELAQRLTVHPSTIKSWTKAGILNSHKANDKNERLYEPPIAGDPRLTVRQGSPLRKRVHTPPAPGGAL